GGERRIVLISEIFLYFFKYTFDVVMLLKILYPLSSPPWQGGERRIVLISEIFLYFFKYTFDVVMLSKILSPLSSPPWQGGERGVVFISEIFSLTDRNVCCTFSSFTLVYSSRARSAVS
ncbi:MAG: hypothetical protein ACHQJ4_07890, partial [Ignavibacteria bacterium]